MITIKSLKKVILTNFLFATSQLFATGICITTVEIHTPNNTNEVCTGSSIVLTSKVINGGTTPKYQWYINEQKVGTDSTNFTFRPISNGFNYVKLVVTSSESCKAEDSTTSETILIVSNSGQSAFVDLQPSYLCDPKQNILHVNTNFNYNVKYRWFINNEELLGKENSYLELTSEQFTDGFNVYVEATVEGTCGNQMTTISNISEFNSAKCKENLGDEIHNPKTIPNNNIIKDTLNNYSKGRTFENDCNVGAQYNHVIDAFYIFESTSDVTSIILNFEDSNLGSSVAIYEAYTPYNTMVSCQNEILNINSREYTFNNLIPNKRYILKVEIGSKDEIGHARLNQLSNTFTIQAANKVSGIENELLKLDKNILKIINLQGKQVENEYKGLVIYQFTDGTTMKVIQ